jgi:CheY-like chemotaxis protein
MPNSVTEQVLTVLYVENNADDLALLQSALKEARHIRLVAFDDLWQAEAFLLRPKESEEPGSQAAAPVLILVDYKLAPGQTALNFLSWVHEQHPELSRIPIAIFSGDDYPGYAAKCYEHGANFYITKPMNYLEWLGFADSLEKCVSVQPPNFECLRELKQYRAPAGAHH